MKKLFLFATVGTLALSSCNLGKSYMSDANAVLNLKRDDLEISKPINTEVSQTLIFGVDFKRLFKADLGYMGRSFQGGSFSSLRAFPSLGMLPIIGGSFDDKTGRVENYAIHKIITDNPGYDCIIYPKYMQKTKNILGIYKKTTGKLELRLGKIK